MLIARHNAPFEQIAGHLPKSENICGAVSGSIIEKRPHQKKHARSSAVLDAKINPPKKLPLTGMPSPLQLRTPGIMSTVELATWVQIGKNAVPQLVSRFGLKELTGNAKNHRFTVHDVLTKILGVVLKSSEDVNALLAPLQKVSWVSQVTGLSTSAISANVCEKRGRIPPPIELTKSSPGQAAARGRRWIPAQIEAHLRGEAIPFLPSEAGPLKSPMQHTQHSVRNVFAAICSSNAAPSR